MRQRKTWREKLADSKDFPRVEPITEKMSKAWGKGTVVIPVPMEVDALMKKVPKGQLTTINHIREFLAKKHGATISCPLTTGIFARIAAEVAMEDETEGKKRITPYWRTLKSGGELNPKYPGGVEGQKKRLQSEGHNVIQRGKRFLVDHYEKSLIRF
jgi:alkylated DNA nucleotide flippase Atl1